MFNKIKLFLLFLPFMACSADYVKDTQAYYHMNLKPTITEVATPTGRIVSVHNPFPRILTITLECDGEINKRTLVVPSGSETSFYTDSDREVSMVCAIEHGWTLK